MTLSIASCREDSNGWDLWISLSSLPLMFATIDVATSKCKRVPLRGGLWQHLFDRDLQNFPLPQLQPHLFAAIESGFPAIRITSRRFVCFHLSVPQVDDHILANSRPRILQ